MVKIYHNSLDEGYQDRFAASQQRINSSAETIVIETGSAE
jgi:hypothetical protein